MQVIVRERMTKSWNGGVYVGPSTYAVPRALDDRLPLNLLYLSRLPCEESALQLFVAINLLNRNLPTSSYNREPIFNNKGFHFKDPSKSYRS